MRVTVRVDASVNTGTGHLMRCLVLARALVGRGHSVGFAMASPDEALGNLVRRCGLPVTELPRPAQGATPWSAAAQHADASALRAKCPGEDLMVVDHYGLDSRWEQSVSAHRLLVIDDLANRPHDCDILLDQNPYEGLDARYDRLVPDRCTRLLGARYALFRDEFYELPRTGTVESGATPRVLIFYGGTDPSNETAKALAALAQWSGPPLAADVVIGATNPHRDSIEAACAGMPNTTLHIQTDRMAYLARTASIALGSGGSAVLERCFLGVPTLATLIADNQVELSRALERRGTILILGTSAEVDAGRIAVALSQMLSDQQRLGRMAAAGIALFGDAAERGVDLVVDALERTA